MFVQFVLKTYYCRAIIQEFDLKGRKTLLALPLPRVFKSQNKMIYP